MEIYVAMYVFPSLIALIPVNADVLVKRFAWGLMFVCFTVLIGLRHEVGGDWDTYLAVYHEFSSATFEDALTYKDPGYGILNWLVGQIDGGVYGVNLVCAAIFVGGLISFCRRQPMPWLAFLVSIPTFAIVVAMGFTRQATALGLVFYALNALVDRRFLKFIVLIVLAGSFHKTALPFLFLPLLIPGKGFLITIPLLCVAVTAAWFLSAPAEALWTLYVDSEMEAAGGFVRVLMNALPAAAFFVFWMLGFGRQFKDRWLWLWFSLVAVMSVFLVDFASSAVDRAALYLAPLQIAVLSRIPDSIPDKPLGLVIGFVILVAYGVVLVTWMLYANNAPHWLPYQNVLFS